MDEFAIVRGLLLRATRGLAGTAAPAKALLEWAQRHQQWIAGSEDRLSWQGLLAALDAGRTEQVLPHALRQARALAGALGLDRTDGALLAQCVAVDRCPRVAELITLLGDLRFDLPGLLAELAGVDAHALRRASVFRLGLARMVAGRRGRVEIEIGWTLEKLLDRGDDSEAGLIEAVVGRRQAARLTPADYPGREAVIDLLVRMISGAVRESAAGVNILIHGPPGTGKTELARTVAAQAGATLFSVGEADDDGKEPSRWDRVDAIMLAQKVLAGRGDCALLFDEMEDFIGESAPAEGGWFTRREGSKVFVNRMVETNPVPVIWTTNAIGNVDRAIVRRMSYVLELGLPRRRAGQQMLDRIAGDEGVALGGDVAALVARAPEAATVLRVAARAAKLGGEPGDALAVAQSLTDALTGGGATVPEPGRADFDLVECDQDIAAIFARIAAPGAPRDVSLLLTGPPGTGKTALAHRLADALDRPLLVKRGSDLLSKWVGGTEKAIAWAFEEARDDEAVLFFDEVDSLLFDRTTAGQHWELSQVNELLTWLDRHPLPFVAATNHARRLDPAAMRRFVFKLELLPLGRERSARAFERFFDMPAPGSLAEVAGLTPGDFAVVKRQLRFAPAASAAAIVERLRAEADAKPGGSGRLGF